MGHYNRIARELAESPEDYAPVLGMDADSGESLWEPWIDGFERAMRLRRGAWTQIVQSGDREEAASINMIVALSDSCYGRSDLTEETEEELRRPAPELIPGFVRNPNALTKSRQVGKGDRGPASFPSGFDFNEPSAFGRKVGRNETCLCGSGRKYKTCCGAD